METKLTVYFPRNYIKPLHNYITLDHAAKNGIRLHRYRRQEKVRYLLTNYMLSYTAKQPEASDNEFSLLTYGNDLQKGFTNQTFN